MAVVVPSLPWLELTAGFGGSSGGPGGSSSISNLPPLPGPPAVGLSGTASLVGSGAATQSPTVLSLFSYYGPGYGMASAGPGGSSSVGSGANTGGASAGRASGNTVGYGSSFNSGYATSLNATNSYGMSSLTIAGGTSSADSEEVVNPSQAPAQNGSEGNASGSAPAQGVSNPGAPMLGVDPRASDNLLKGGVRTSPSTGVTGTTGR